MGNILAHRTCAGSGMSKAEEEKVNIPKLIVYPNLLIIHILPKIKFLEVYYLLVSKTCCYMCTTCYHPVPNFIQFHVFSSLRLIQKSAVMAPVALPHFSYLSTTSKQGKEADSELCQNTPVQVYLPAEFISSSCRWAI